VNRTRFSLYYLSAYLIIIGAGLLLIPGQTLRWMLSDGHYGAVFPRLAGMLMSGLGMNIAGIIRARAEVLYPATLGVRTYFIICLSTFYVLTRDPFFLVLLGIVLIGMTLTLLSYLSERTHVPALESDRGRAAPGERHTE
jgi:hypothetical protein